MFRGIQVGQDESALVRTFLGAHDFSFNSRKAFLQDIRKFASWFSSANHESFQVARVTVRDLTDFRNGLRRERGQAVATVNRSLVTLRRLFGWLTDQGHIPANPPKPVKELRRQALAPKGLDRSEVRRLLREVELRQDIRAVAISSMVLYTGCRVSDLISLELHDLMLSVRSGTVVFRFGKGGKQRSVPLPLVARRAMQAYLEIRPPSASDKVFV
jgi:integrase/recombinase XerC